MSCAMRGQRYGQAELLPDFLQIRYVRLFQVGHVHERHPAQVETQQEHVPGIVHLRAGRQLHVADSPERIERQGPFRGLGDAGVDVFERMPLRAETLLHGPVVHRPQDAEVEGRGVFAHARHFEMQFIRDHDLRVDLPETHVPSFSETGEVAQGRIVGLAGPYPSLPAQPADHLLHESEQRIGALRGRIIRQNVGVRIGSQLLLVRGDDPVQPVGIPGDAVLQHGEVVFTPFIGARRDENASRSFVPLRGEEFVAGADAVGPAVVDDPVEQGALLAIDGRGPEFRFYGCHIAVTSLIILQ